MKGCDRRESERIVEEEGGLRTGSSAVGQQADVS